jgi:hypothetical protein
MKKALNAEYIPIPLSERRKERIVLVTPQLLGINHAPTKVALEFARAMVTTLHKEVLLLVTVIRGDAQVLHRKICITVHILQTMLRN